MRNFSHITQMKINLFILIAPLLLFSCGSSNSPIKSIEKIFEFEIPDCYMELDNPEQKFDFNPHTIIELQFEDDCVWDLYKNQMNKTSSSCRKHYVGTTVWADPAWHNYKEKAIMYLDLESGILHFEDYD